MNDTGAPITPDTTETPVPAGRPGLSGPPSMSGRAGALEQPGPFEQPARSGSSGKTVLFGMMGAGLLLCGIGLVMNGRKSSPQPAPVPAPNFFTEQQQMAREAMQMAREAQKMQQEHMRMLQQQMEENSGERLPTADAESPGGGR